MLIEIFSSFSFLSMTLILVSLGLAWYFLACGGLYWLLHRSSWRQRAEPWRTQKAWPTRTQVRGEIIDGTLSMSMVMLVVSASFWCGIHGYSGLYAQPDEYGYAYIGLSIVGVFLIMEIFEWTFHWACHRVPFLWKVHKHHHRYANPTAFGVMADQPLDMLVKGSPILFIPFLFPIWDVALIGTFVTLNFIYGTYLHAGFDFPFMPSPHSRYLVGAWHHNEHHSGAVDYNYGFFTGFMDLIFGTRYTPCDKSARRPTYRCPECRNSEKLAA